MDLNRWLELDSLIKAKTKEMQEIERKEAKTIIAYLTFEAETFLRKAKKVEEEGETVYEFENGKDMLEYLDIQKKLDRIVRNVGLSKNDIGQSI